jgi:hypothetical protein
MNETRSLGLETWGWIWETGDRRMETGKWGMEKGKLITKN